MARVIWRGSYQRRTGRKCLEEHLVSYWSSWILRSQRSMPRIGWMLCDTTIVKTFVQYDTEVDIQFAHMWNYNISSGSTN